MGSSSTWPARSSSPTHRLQVFAGVARIGERQRNLDK